MKIPSPMLEVEHIRLRNLDDYFRVAQESRRDWTHHAAWVDVLAKGSSVGRGIYTRSRFTECDARPPAPKAGPSIPFEAPASLIAYPTIKLFNAFYGRKLFAQARRENSRSLRSRFLPAGRAAELEPHLRSRRLLPVSVRGPEGAGAGIDPGAAECHGGGRAGVVPHRPEGVRRRAQPRPALVPGARHDAGGRLPQSGQAHARSPRPPGRDHCGGGRAASMPPRTAAPRLKCWRRVSRNSIASGSRSTRLSPRHSGDATLSRDEPAASRARPWSGRSQPRCDRLRVAVADWSRWPLDGRRPARGRFSQSCGAAVHRVQPRRPCPVAHVFGRIFADPQSRDRPVEPAVLRARRPDDLPARDIGSDDGGDPAGRLEAAHAYSTSGRTPSCSWRRR